MHILLPYNDATVVLLINCIFLYCNLIFFATFWSAPEKTNCDASIKWDVTDEVKLTQFDCALGKHGGEPSLIFTVGLQNTTDIWFGLIGTLLGFCLV